jgi:hypothetical protein
MFQKAKQTGRATWPALVLILAATMRGSLAQIGDFAKGDGEQTATLDAAIKAVTLAKSIPAIFPPGSALTELPSKKWRGAHLGRRRSFSRRTEASRHRNQQAAGAGQRRQ